MTDHQSTLRELIAQWAGSSRIALDMAKQFRAKGNTGAAGRAEERSIVFDICAQGLRALLSAEDGRQQTDHTAARQLVQSWLAEDATLPAVEDGRKDEETLRDAARRFKAAWEARQQGIDHDGALASDVTAARKKLFALASRPAEPQEPPR